MPDVSVNIEVWCSCGKGLCDQSGPRGQGVEVKPCPDCMQDNYDEGYSDGQTAAMEA